MWFLGYVATYLAAAVIGLYLNEFFSSLITFSSHFEGEKKWDRAKAARFLLKQASSAFGAGAALVGFMHALPWSAFALAVILGNVTPVFLFFVTMNGIRLAKLTYNKWLATRK